MSNTPPHSFTDIYGQLVGTANPKNIDTKNTAPIID
ncbi:MAG: hypothetical protein QG561_512, partial [Patescibacteria group bacterium]|nr:hypothetical protein [Patescibacteria group bacterium]